MSYILYVQPLGWALSALVAAGCATVIWRRRRWRKAALRCLLGTAAFALLILPAVAFVPAGHRGVVYRWGGGVDPNERGEGITLLVPWVQTIRMMNVRTQKVFSPKVFSQSSDLQEITVVGSVNYHVRPDRAADIYQSIGPAYRETVIQPALFQRVKAAVGQVRAEDFALQRSNLASTIQRELTAQLADYGLDVEWVNIEDAIFQKPFVLAVQAKIIAEQEAARQRNLIAAKAAEKQQVIITAQAKAAAIRIEAKQQAWANRVIERSLAPKVLYWRWLTTWNGQLPTTLVGADKNLTLLLGAGASAVYGYGG